MARRLDADAANVRRALAWARDAGDAELVLRVMTALDEWWFARGLWVEGRAWLEWALDRADRRVAPELRSAGWQALGYLLWPEDDFERVLDAADRSWELSSAADDRTGMTWCQIQRAHTRIAAGDLDGARTAASNFPALDLAASGTLRPDLLVGAAGAEAIASARAEMG